MPDRKKLSAQLDTHVYLANAGDCRTIEIREVATDALVATVNIGDLFDADGNRFENDLD